MNPHANDRQGRIHLPPVKIWRHNIVPYLNTGDRHTMRQTGQRTAENTPQTPCTPCECVRIPLCLNKCDTFWVKASQLLTDVLWTLQSFADTHKNMVVQFEMMDLELLLWWTPGLGLFVHQDDVPKPPPPPVFAINRGILPAGHSEIFQGDISCCRHLHRTRRAIQAPTHHSG